MASNISPKAEVSPKAKIGDNCTIYPFVYIEDDVVIGDNCTIYPNVSIMNGTRMGDNNTVFQGSVISAIPQDFAYTGEATETVIGKGNIIRENVVINRATHKGGKTVIGNDNFLMEGSHVSHDTSIGNCCVLGYGAKVAGDCRIGHGVILSTTAIVNAKVRIGDLSMVQASSTVSKDVPPYIIAGGKPIAYGGPNRKLMAEAAMTEQIQKHVANAYRLLFHGQNSTFDAALQIKSQVPDSEEIRNIISFLDSTTLGIITK